MNFSHKIFFSIFFSLSFSCFADTQTLNDDQFIQDSVLGKKEQATYLGNRLDKKDSDFHGFQHVYGACGTAPFVLFVFTSLTCPACATIHTNILPEFLHSAALKEGKLAVVLRDYPTDPLSLNASSCVWCHPEKAEKLSIALFEKASNPSETWVQDIDTLKKAMKELCDSKDEWDTIEKKAFADSSVKKKVFKERENDRDILDIKEVPSVFLLIRKKNSSELLKLPQMPTWSIMQKIIQHYEKEDTDLKEEDPDLKS